MRWLIFIGLISQSVLLFAQTSNNFSLILDSAESILFNEYATGLTTLEGIEREINRAGVEKNIESLHRINMLRLTLNRYFFHPTACRQSLHAAEKLIEQHKSSLGLRFDTYRNDIDSEWAGFYSDIGDYEKAIEIYSKLAGYYRLQPNTPENCLNLFRITQYQASIHEQRGEIESAINQYLASIEYYKCSIKPSAPSNFALVFRNVGEGYLEKLDLKNARIYFKRAEDSLNSSWGKFKNTTELANAAITLYETLSRFYQQINAFDSAWLAIKKAERFLIHSKPFQARYQVGLGHAYKGLGKKKLAEQCYDRGIALLKEVDNTGRLLADCYVAKGDLYADLKKFETSLSHYQRAIACLVVEFDPNRDDNPNLGMVFSKKKLFSVLQQKYRVLELMSREDKADLKMLVRAWQTNRLALALLDSIANEFSLERDRIILAEQSFKANEDGLRLGYQLFLKSKEEHYLKDCFSIAEKSKSILLLENIRRVNRFAGINKEWQDKERDLKSEILYYEQEIYHATAKEKNTKQLLTLREEYNQTRHQYALLMEKIKKENPHFYHLRFDRNAISEATIQSELLANGDALIEFFIGENQMAIFGFSKKSSYAEVQDTPTDLNYKLLQFRKLLTSADSLTPGKEYDRLAKELFAVLMANCLKSLGPVTRLIIVPDGILGYLPFEVLQEQREGNSPLISNYTITYAYSASYLHEQVFKQSSPASHFFAGFTSDANPAGVHKSPGLAALKYARKEITTISETLGQGYKVFDHCTKQEFMDNAPDYTVLHLAMHATTNDENPMFSAMMFSPSKADSNSFDPLFAIDLYSFQLKAKLVVLSACETGLGEWHRGEGIISLSRAFAYSGVPSSVISLWKVPDKATSILMKSFYGHLKSENSKDAALALAKRDFVKNYPQMSHPYYWSGFILMGDHRSLEFPENRLWIYILSGITILLLTTLFFWRRNQIRQKEKIAHE